VYKAPRGTSDVLPADQPYWRHALETATRMCELRGYERIDTPVFEDAGLFVRTVGADTDIVEKEVYTFHDKGSSLLTLRPEGTAPVCRAYIEHGMRTLPQPVRLYYVAPLFRYERPQAGRFRQHHQFGFEAIGEADPALDAEVIDLAWQLYLALGLRGLVLYLNSIGDAACRPAYLAALRHYYGPLRDRLCADCRKRLERNPLRLLDCKQPGCAEFAADAPRSFEHLCAACAAHFGAVRGYLDALGVEYTLEHRLVRGLDYYTRTVFEVQPPEEGAQSTIGGGGRYDGLIEQLGGPPTPGIGFATGLERIVLNLKRQGVAVAPHACPIVYVAFAQTSVRTEALRLLARVRAAGISAISAFGERSLKAQLRDASRQGARHALLLGEEEVSQGLVTVRDLERGEQTRMPMEQALEALRSEHPMAR